MTADKRGRSPQISGHPRSSQRPSAHAISDHLRHGQAVIEYAALLAIVVAALVAMRIYLKRGVSGLLAGAANSLGSQFDPRDTTGTITTTSTDNSTTTAKTLNEPELTSLLKDECRAGGKPSAECDAICVDLNEDGNCTDTRVFGEISETTLNTGTTTTDSKVTVGPLGKDLWAR